MKHIYVVIDKKEQDGLTNGIRGVWTNWKRAREQAALIRSYRESDDIKIVAYESFNAEAGYWYEKIFTEPMPKPF